MDLEIDGPLLNEVKALRSELHEIGEIAFKEKRTAAFITNYIEKMNPHHLYTKIGGEGIVAGWVGKEEGASLLFRAELDALPVEGEVRHLCGHDGHMAILLGVATLLSTNRDFKGSVWLLFQPAEEIGEGAARMIEEIDELGLTFDYSFALHNRPGRELNKVLIYSTLYAAGSFGLEFHFKGHQAHASHPEEANSPYEAMVDLVEFAQKLESGEEGSDDYHLITLVNFQLGEVNYGVTPGEGWVRFTVRAYSEEQLKLLEEQLVAFAKERVEGEGITLSYSLFDRFPVTRNSEEANKMVEEAAKGANLEYNYCSIAGRGSDDFGFFSQLNPSSYFNIGNGVVGGELHQLDYRFSDSVLESGLKLYSALIWDR